MTTGFFTAAHTFGSDSPHSGFSSLAGVSCGFGLHSSLNYLNEWDWSNTHATGGFANSGSNADVNHNPVGSTGKLVREADGTVKLYTGGTLRFTTQDKQRAGVHFWIGHSNTAGIDWDDLTWTAY